MRRRKGLQRTEKHKNAMIHSASADLKASNSFLDGIRPNRIIATARQATSQMGCTSLSSSRGPMESDFDETHRTDLDTPWTCIRSWLAIPTERACRASAMPIAVFMTCPCAFGKSR